MRQFNVVLDFTCSTSALAGLHHESEYCEANRMTQRRELVGMVVNF
jgi:hypothetical protein